MAICAKKVVSWIVAALIIFFIISTAWSFWSVRSSGKRVTKEVNRAMIGADFNSVFPAGYMSGSIHSKLREQPCRTPAGGILPAEIPAAKPLNGRIDRTVPPCEPELRSFALWRDPGNGRVHFGTRNTAGLTENWQTVPRQKFEKIVFDEFKGREFYAGFDFQIGHSPMRVSYGMWFGKDGKVESIQQPHSWD